MKTIGAGRRNCPIEIQTDVPTTNADGQLISDWDAIAAIPEYAHIVARGGQEARRFEQLRAEVDYLVIVLNNRRTETVKARSHRILWEGKILNIDSVVDPDSRNRFLEIRCTEVQK